MTRQDRYRGALLGLAAGDALGTTVEFRSRGTSSRSPTSSAAARSACGRGVDRRHLDGAVPGREPDRGGGFDAARPAAALRALVPPGTSQQHRQLLRHRQHGPRRRSLRFERTGEPWCGSTDPQTAGNGSLDAPGAGAAVLPRRSGAALARAATARARRTARAEAVDACRYFAGLIVGALQGRSQGRAARAVLHAACDGSGRDDPLAPAIAEVASGSFIVEGAARRSAAPATSCDRSRPRCGRLPGATVRGGRAAGRQPRRRRRHDGRDLRPARRRVLRR